MFVKGGFGVPRRSGISAVVWPLGPIRLTVGRTSNGRIALLCLQKLRIR